MSFETWRLKWGHLRTSANQAPNVNFRAELDPGRILGGKHQEQRLR